MRVLQVLNHFMPYQTAGTEVYTWALSKHLQKAGVSIEIIIPHYQSRQQDMYEYDGLKVIRYPEPSKVNRALIMGKSVPDGLGAFEAYLLDAKPDVVHFHELAGSNGITLHHVKAAKASGAKVVFTFHLAGYSCRTGNVMWMDKELCDGKIDIQRCSRCFMHNRGYVNLSTWIFPPSYWLYRLGVNTTNWDSKIGTALGFPSLIHQLKESLNTLFAHCDRLVVLTQWYKEVLLLNNLPADKIIHIPQAIPVMPGNTTYTTLPTIHPLRLLFIGRVSAFKGLHLLLEALQSLPQEKIQLSIYGPTHDREYEQRCKQLSAQLANVRWCGIIAPDQVIGVMRQHHMLCLPSTFSEMSPLVIQEAFLAGIPIIGSNAAGIREQIQHGRNGLLFQFGNAQDLAKQLSSVVEDLSLIEKLRQNIIPPRSFECLAEEMLQVYQNL